MEVYIKNPSISPVKILILRINMFVNRVSDELRWLVCRQCNTIHRSTC